MQAEARRTCETQRHEMFSQVATVRDAEGRTQTYRSKEEMPPDVRARFEEAMRRRPSGGTEPPAT